jgi:hypothetical protein
MGSSTLHLRRGGGNKYYSKQDAKFSNAQIACIKDTPGNNSLSTLTIVTSVHHGVVYPKIGSTIQEMDTRIIIGQVHGHPATIDTTRKTIEGMSDIDTLAAHCLQAPVYAIEAMGGKIGSSAYISRVNPIAGKAESGKDIDIHIGKTRGQSNEGIEFNIGMDALKSWGTSEAPDLKCLSNWEEAMKRISLRSP